MNVASVRKSEWAIINLIKKNLNIVSETFWSKDSSELSGRIVYTPSTSPSLIYIWSTKKLTTFFWILCMIWWVMRAKLWCKKSSLWDHKSPWIPKVSFWSWKWELSDCPACFLTNTIKSVWKIQACLEETGKHVSRLNSSSLEFSSCHPKVFWDEVLSDFLCFVTVEAWLT